jgi:hypothetical protein
MQFGELVECGPEASWPSIIYYAYVYGLSLFGSDNASRRTGGLELILNNTEFAAQLMYTAVDVSLGIRPAVDAE